MLLLLGDLHQLLLSLVYLTVGVQHGALQAYGFHQSIAHFLGDLSRAIVKFELPEIAGKNGNSLALDDLFLHLYTPHFPPRNRFAEAIPCGGRFKRFATIDQFPVFPEGMLDDQDLVAVGFVLRYIFLCKHVLPCQVQHSFDQFARLYLRR
jgi:hypothetical protein